MGISFQGRDGAGSGRGRQEEKESRRQRIWIERWRAKRRSKEPEGKEAKDVCREGRRRDGVN
ncbi:hypothetical protein E2C01_064610 [Portunus trituberculatus]|uniref:Uncharacterized protein n=1 Tax=Portunus trituberculatus TaxID=210409 RepID=A0A5B7HP93_PORTR|nr:hypothetical protein [Portunus trituberculatus]